jgi:ketosteroid isomerase-like protein
MRNVAYALVAVLAAAVACRGGASAPAVPVAPAAPADVVNAGRSAVEAWRQAYEVRSADALAKLYAHDADVEIVQDGVPLRGWTAIEPVLRKRFEHAKDIHVKLKDEAVIAIGPAAAAVAATMTREISDGVTTVTENGALTLVLHHDPAGWVIVVEHYSYKRP